MRLFPIRVMFVVGLSLLIFTQQSWADSSCFNVGVVNKKVIDKKEKNSVAGDIKSLEISYDYEVGQISGSITWNKVPTSKLITTITIGETSQDPRCNDIYENYLMTGWTKKLKLDPETLRMVGEKSWVGRIQVLPSAKNSLDFVWTQPSFHAGEGMTHLCVAVFTNRIGSAYSNSTSCVGNAGFFTCQGPGYIESWNEIDFVQSFAFQKGREVDPDLCRFPLGQAPGS